MHDALSRAQAHAKDWLDSLETGSVAPTASEAELRAAFDAPLPETGTDPANVVDFIAQHARNGLIGSTGGRFFAWVIGGSLPSALATDWLVSAWDQNPALYACSPAAAVIEDITGGWIKDLLGLPAAASFAFTTGCQMARMTALAAARHAVLRARGWNVEEDGLFGAPKVRILTSANKHGSIERAVRYLGFGRSAMQGVQTDTLKIMHAINETGEAFFSDTVWQGRRAMRISVVNWQTSKADIARTLAAISDVLDRHTDR